MFDEDRVPGTLVGIGMASNGALLIVIHLWTEMDSANVNVRIISARNATDAEEATYSEAQ